MCRGRSWYIRGWRDGGRGRLSTLGWRLLDSGLLPSKQKRISKETTTMK
jgi:hypothetical protein